jgi:hypothetical protein
MPMDRATLEALDREIRQVLDELRNRTNRETFRVVLRLEELMTTRTSMLLDEREGAQTDPLD